MTNIVQVTVTSDTTNFTELNASGGAATYENLGPETVYIYNGYGSNPTFSSTTWYALFAGKTATYAGNTEGINALAVTSGGTAQVNVITTP